jgi:hypothetical protein
LIAISRRRPEGIPLAYLKGRITFIDGSQLVVAELVSPTVKAYRFHYLDQRHRLIARWDTAPHHRHLHTFPYHRHTPEGVMESTSVNLPDVLDLIQDQLIKRLGTA